MLRQTAQLYHESFAGLSRDIWLLSLITLVNRAGTMVIPFMTVYLTQVLGFSLAEAGYVMSCFGLGSIAGSYIGGRLTDSIGYYQTQFWTLFLSGIMFIVLLAMKSLAAVCITIFFLSVIADAFRPANYASVAVYSRRANRTRSYSLLRLAVNLGFSVGPALGGWIAFALGYDWLFWVDGLTCIAAALLLRLFLTQKEEVEETDTATMPPPGSGYAYRDRIFLVFIFFVTLTAIAFMQFFSTIPVFYKAYFGFSEGRIGTLLALNGLLVAIFEMPLVYRLEGRLNKMQLVALGTLLVGFSYLLYVLFEGSLLVAFFAVATITFGEIFSMPFANSLVIDRSTPRTRGQYMGLYTMSYSIALVIAPTVGLQIAEQYGFVILMYGLCSLCVIAFLGFLLLRKKMEG
jgi:predicted MFS family arabinose efflux permease